MRCKASDEIRPSVSVAPSLLVGPIAHRVGLTEVGAWRDSCASTRHDEPQGCSGSGARRGDR